MSAGRRRRLITVLYAVLSLVFMQLAVAGYACPVDGEVGEAAAMAAAGMPCAGEMSSVDTDQPGLCHAHCQSTQQSADKVQAPTPVGAMASGSAYTLQPVRVSPPAHPTQASLLLRSTAPPIAVRNCCLRI